MQDCDLEKNEAYFYGKNENSGDIGAGSDLRPVERWAAVLLCIVKIMVTLIADGIYSAVNP